MKMLLPGERAGLRKGRQEGRQETLRQGILDILEVRFGAVPEGVRQKIHPLGDEIRLKKLQRSAVLSKSIGRFAKEL